MTNKELFQTIHQMNEGSGLRILRYVNWKELTLIQKVIVCVMQPVVYIAVPCVIAAAVVAVIAEIGKGSIRSLIRKIIKI